MGQNLEVWLGLAPRLIVICYPRYKAFVLPPRGLAVGGEKEEECEVCSLCNRFCRGSGIHNPIHLLTTGDAGQ